MEREHEWGTHTSPMGSQLIACRVCGIVKRNAERIKRDGPNKACKGFVRVELRDALSDAERTKVSSQASGHERVEPKERPPSQWRAGMRDEQETELGGGAEP